MRINSIVVRNICSVPKIIVHGFLFETTCIGTCCSRKHEFTIVGGLFEGVLGITQAENSSAYDKIVIAPSEINALDFAKGHITTEKGKISVVSYIKLDPKRFFNACEVAFSSSNA